MKGFGQEKAMILRLSQQTHTPASGVIFVIIACFDTCRGVCRLIAGIDCQDAWFGIRFYVRNL